MAKNDKYHSIPAGVEAISSRSAAAILGCSMGHVRNLASQGKFGKTYKVSSRSLMIDAGAVREYRKATKRPTGRGRPRGGFAIDT